MNRQRFFRLIKCRLIPNGFCVNLFGSIWTKDPSWIDSRVINHELIHTEQQKELLFIPFYVIYFLEWLYRLALYRNWKSAYYAISFEREAYSHGHDLTYLDNRKRYSWVKYFNLKKV